MDSLYKQHQDLVKKRRFCAIYISNASFYQDRLGTNIGKALKIEWRFLTWVGLRYLKLLQRV